MTILLDSDSVICVNKTEGSRTVLSLQNLFKHSAISALALSGFTNKGEAQVAVPVGIQYTRRDTNGHGTHAHFKSVDALTKQALSGETTLTFLDSGGIKSSSQTLMLPQGSTYEISVDVFNLAGSSGRSNSIYATVLGAGGFDGRGWDAPDEVYIYGVAGTTTDVYSGNDASVDKGDTVLLKGPDTAKFRVWTMGGADRVYGAGPGTRSTITLGSHNDFYENRGGQDNLSGNKHSDIFRFTGKTYELGGRILITDFQTGAFADPNFDTRGDILEFTGLLNVPAFPLVNPDAYVKIVRSGSTPANMIVSMNIHGDGFTGTTPPDHIRVVGVLENASSRFNDAALAPGETHARALYARGQLSLIGTTNGQMLIHQGHFDSDMIRTLHAGEVFGHNDTSGIILTMVFGKYPHHPRIFDVNDFITIIEEPDPTGNPLNSDAAVYYNPDRTGFDPLTARMIVRIEDGWQRLDTMRDPMETREEYLFRTGHIAIPRLFTDHVVPYALIQQGGYLDIPAFSFANGDAVILDTDFPLLPNYDPANSPTTNKIARVLQSSNGLYNYLRIDFNGNGGTGPIVARFLNAGVDFPIQSLPEAPGETPAQVMQEAGNFDVANQPAPGM